MLMEYISYTITLSIWTLLVTSYTPSFQSKTIDAGPLEQWSWKSHSGWGTSHTPLLHALINVNVTSMQLYHLWRTRDTYIFFPGNLCLQLSEPKKQDDIELQRVVLLNAIVARLPSSFGGSHICIYSADVVKGF